MSFYKSYKVRLYPTKSQAVIIDQTIGNSRFIYNKMLEERQEVYQKLKDNKEKLLSHKYKTEKEYKEEFPFLKDGSSRALQQARGNLDTAYRNFFQSLKKGKKVGFPKFKKKSKVRWSYREPQVNNFIEIKENKVKLLKLGFIKFRGLNKKFNGKICSVTVSNDRDNKYYASVLTEKESLDKKFRTGNGVIGIDVGLKTFTADSNGNLYTGIKEVTTNLDKKLKILQRHFSRKKNPSNRKEKLRIKIAGVYKKKTNIQNHFFWHLANELCRNNQTVVIENLNISGMMKNRKLSHSIHESGWGKFTNILKHKSVEYFTDAVEAPRFFPSSKTCSVCGQVKKDLVLSDREFICECGNMIDRDINAAINLKKLKSAEYADNTRGEIIRPVNWNFHLTGKFLRSENTFI